MELALIVGYYCCCSLNVSSQVIRRKDVT